MANSKIITLPTISDERGCLTILEREIEFPIKRIFWIYGADGEKRGGHRHKVTKQALIAINGEVSINIRKNNDEINLRLNQPSKCLILEPEDWHTMEFQKGSILLVAASHFFNKNDYIYDVLFE